MLYTEWGFYTTVQQWGLRLNKYSLRSIGDLNTCKDSKSGFLTSSASPPQRGEGSAAKIGFINKYHMAVNNTARPTKVKVSYNECLEKNGGISEYSL